MTKDTINKFMNPFYHVMSKYANIFIGNPNDLLELNMNDFYENTYFISSPYLEQGKMIKIIDKDMKYDLIKFCTEHEDRIFRGCKQDGLR